MLWEWQPLCIPPSTDSGNAFHIRTLFHCWEQITAAEAARGQRASPRRSWQLLSFQRGLSLSCRRRWVVRLQVLDICTLGLAVACTATRFIHFPTS